MKVEDDTRQFSLEELKRQRERGETQTRADAPVYPVDAEFWASARVVVPSPGKTSVHLRLDSDAGVLDLNSNGVAICIVALCGGANAYRSE